MSEYTPTIGLEIHIQLKTNTKLFSRSKNDSDEKRPNVNVSPIDLGHPGTLPSINKEAIKSVLKVGIAINGNLADYTEWDRKNYFYPDIPKAYQISQYKYPLVTGGRLADVDITRIHLEEDTGRSLHDQGEGSLVDYNRAGIPLMELVTEPVIHSAEHAGRFARELQLLLRKLGVATAHMEKGEMRVEANISVSKTSTFGTKVEVKNINSFKAMERAVEYEIARQKELLDRGEVVVQETRGWNDVKQETFSQRSKENAHDYRYFPDPDIPKLWVSEIPEFQREVLLKEIPELPDETRYRLVKQYNLNKDVVEELVIDPSALSLFESSVINDISNNSDIPRLIANYIVSDIRGIHSGTEKGSIDHITPEALFIIASFVTEGKLSSRGAKDTLLLLYKEGGDVHTIVEKNGFLQQNDSSALEGIVDKVIADNPHVVADIKSGKEQLIQFLIGQCMKHSKGSANPQLVHALIKEKLRI